MEAGDVYQIVVAKSCRKEINRHPPQIRKAVERALEKIAESPFRGNHIKPLLGELSGKYRYDVGSYRIIYMIDAGSIIVFVVDFGPRGDIYK